MAKAVCPDCDALVGISPTGGAKHEGWSAQWWLVDMHRCLAPCAGCKGSGIVEWGGVFLGCSDPCEDCLGKGVVGRVCGGSGKRV